jgi:hypothetical protein
MASGRTKVEPRPPPSLDRVLPPTPRLPSLKTESLLELRAWPAAKGHILGSPKQNILKNDLSGFQDLSLGLFHLSH